MIKSIIMLQIHHQFAAWAASTAASASPKCRFSVADGVGILEAIGFGPGYARPDKLPAPVSFDKCHRRWRERGIREAKKRGITMSHGVAAKLINVYLKSRFTCGGHANHPKVKAIHPPVDSILLRTLADKNYGGLGPTWRKLNSMRWSKFDSDTYQLAIDCIKSIQNPEPLWAVELHWNGFE